jgi:phosphatidylglycerol:prolipoprotein diacylglycerol transferase
MNPIMIDLGFVQITWYSVLIILGVLIATAMTVAEALKYNISKEFINNLIFWTVIFGIIGARLYYVLFNWQYYSANTSEIYKIWNGGLAIHGALIGGFLFVLVYCIKYKVRLLRITDITAPGLLIAQAIGRWGNFFNTEAHGSETTKVFLESLKIVPNFIIEGMKISGIYYQPTFYYESLWCILGFIIILLIRAFYKYLRIGQLTGIYLMWYGAGRFFIEILSSLAWRTRSTSNWKILEASIWKASARSRSGLASQAVISTGRSASTRYW